MTLSPEQKQAVANWVAAGDSLSTLQKKLSEQFKLSLTYMDVRFLVDDLGLELKSAARPPQASGTSALGSPGPGEAAPPRPVQPEKRGLMDKLKEKVGLGGDRADDANQPPPEDEEFPEDEFPPEAAGAGPVKVEVDRIVRPGAVASGTVSFSDGVSGKWALDQYGRLMLETGRKGYQPPASDVQAFQRELSLQLQRQGY